MPWLPWFWNCVERPKQVACAGIEASHITRSVNHRRRTHTYVVGRPDNNNVSNDGSWRASSNRPDERDTLTGPVIFIQIEDAVVSKDRDGIAGMSIECDELVPWGHNENAVVAGSITPVGDTST
jgi:hypothetical protein